MTKLIGIHGYKESGKDTIAGFIEEWAAQRGYSSATRYWATKMKESLAATLGIPIEHIDDFKLTGTVEVKYSTDSSAGITHYHSLTGREVHQKKGTEGGREVFGWDFWIDQLVPPGEWERNFDEADVCIIADCRFENELQRILDCGGTNWIVESDRVQSDGHKSEQLFPELCQRVIPNNLDTTLDELRHRVRYELGEGP